MATITFSVFPEKSRIIDSNGSPIVDASSNDVIKGDSTNLFQDWDRVSYSSFLKTFYHMTEDIMFYMQTPYVTIHAEEDRNTSNNVQDASSNEVVDSSGNNIITTNQALLMQSQWDWAEAD